MLFASTDVGINIYDEKDSLIHKMSFPFDWRNGGGVIVSDSIGQVYITDSKTLFLVNTPDKTILTITKFPYGYYQNITVSIFDSTRLIVSAQNGNANGSVLFLINKNNGEILAKWSTTENISSCTVKNDHTIYVFTFSNKILKLVFKSNLFK
jgi:hypothetical protein